MLIKYIICIVRSENRMAFSKAQEAWSKTKESEGFLCQIGGWNQNKSNEAVIISFWEDQSSLDKFMHNKHDDIFYQSEQLQTYDEITISHIKYSNLNIDKSIFMDEIDISENLITTNTEEKSKIDFTNNTIYLSAQNLKNKRISLIEAWKVN